MKPRSTGGNSLIIRCTLAVAIVVIPLACQSSRNAQPTTTATSSTTAPTTTSTTSTTTTTTTTTSTVPPTTTEPPVTQGAIVKVANASGVDGAAAQLTDEFTALGFTTRDGTNAAGIDKDLKTSKIYAVTGTEAVAASVSRLMNGIQVLPMPTPAWINGGTAGLGDATVLVMLGHDLAGIPLGDMRGSGAGDIK